MSVYRTPPPKPEGGPGRTLRGRLRSLQRASLIWWKGSWQKRRWRCHCGHTWPRRGRLKPGWANTTVKRSKGYRQGCPACVPIPRNALKPEVCALCGDLVPWGNPYWICRPCWEDIQKPPSTMILKQLRGAHPKPFFVRW